jgi:L-ascorbate metabolism protein UlaG (beta-lactamase superfamily)
MKIKKLGHCCFIADINGKRIMTDPGSFSTLQNNEQNIDLVVITHEHADHLHIDSLKAIIKNNPNVLVITNTAVGKLLTEAGITFTKVEDKEIYDFSGVAIKGFGTIHAEIYGDFSRVQNTGYLIDSLCFPGDAFELPHKDVDILALPIAGPWMKIKEAIDYAKAVKPRICFGVHDAILSPSASFVWKLPAMILEKDNIAFKQLEIGKEEEV